MRGAATPPDPAPRGSPRPAASARPTLVQGPAARPTIDRPNVPTQGALEPPVTLAQNRAAPDASQLPEEVHERLRDAGLKLERVGDDLFIRDRKQNVNVQLSLSGGDATLTGSLEGNGSVSLRVDYSASGATRDVNLDFVARTISHTFRVGNYVSHSQHALPYGRGELINLFTGAERGDPSVRAHGTFVELDGRRDSGVAPIFAPHDPSVLEQMQYFRITTTGLGDGDVGTTIRHRAFVSRNATPATVSNELSHQAWERLADKAFTVASEGRPFDGADWSRFRDELHSVP